MNKHIKFTIGIPAYKDNFLALCINSILQQTYKNFEIVIVNDCSPNNIKSVINDFKDTKIKYFENEKNIGKENLVKNWNKCLELARGEYFILMGDDDILEKNYLEEFSKLIDKYPSLDIFHCRTTIIDENSIPVELTPSWPEYENLYEMMMHRVRNLRMQYISDFVFRTEKLKSIGGFYPLPLAWGTDDLTAFIVASEKGIAHINIPLLKYRKSNINLSAIGDPLKKIEAINLQQEWFTKFLNNEPDNKFDLLNYRIIKNELHQYIKRKKIKTVSEALNTNFASLTYFIKSRNKIKMSFLDLTNSFFYYIVKKFFYK